MKTLFCLGLILLLGANNVYPAVSGPVATQAGPTWAVVAEVAKGLKSESPDYKKLGQLADTLNRARVADFPGDPTAALLTLLDLRLKIVAIAQEQIRIKQAQYDQTDATTPHPFPDLPANGASPDSITDPLLRKRYEEYLATLRLMSQWRAELSLLTNVRDGAINSARTLISVRLRQNSLATIESLLAKYFSDPAFSKQFVDAIPKE